MGPPMVSCEFCGDTFRSFTAGTFVYTEGWMEQRNDGGGNCIALPKRSNRWACPVCIQRLRSGVHPSQGVLL